MLWQQLIACVFVVVLGLCAGLISFYVSRGRVWWWGFIAYVAGVLFGAFTVVIVDALVPSGESYLDFLILAVWGGVLLVLVTSAIGTVAGLLLPSKRANYTR